MGPESARRGSNPAARAADGDGDAMLQVLAALGHVQRLRILGALAGGREYVSQLARTLQISRPLLHMHLQRLEAAGLVEGSAEIGPDGKAMKFFQVTDFMLRLTPGGIAAATRTLTNPIEETRNG